MKKEDFFELLGELDGDIVKAAKAPAKRPLTWRVWGTAAACLCLAALGLLSLSYGQDPPEDRRETTEQVYTLPQAASLRAELVAWGGDHFQAVVVDAEDNGIFPDGAELSVVFEGDTEILLDDGTVLLFDPDEPDAESIGWEAGTVVSVEFLRYEEYRAGNHFYNQLFASHVQAADP